MSSILTNTSAMVALETLRGINKGLSEVQSQISTGKKVANAKDNAAIFAISTVMQSDVNSFNQVSDSLNLGSSTVGVARAAAENVTGLLQEMKDLFVSAQSENVDREKIQTDIDELTNQIGSVVNAAQFNGQNLVKGGGSISILSSLDRGADQTVTASSISVSRSSLETTAASVGSNAITSGAGSITVSNSGNLVVNDGSDDGELTLTLASGDLNITTEAGGTLSYSIGGFGTAITYTAQVGDTQEDIATALATQISAVTDITATVAESGGNQVITIANASTTTAVTVTSTVNDDATIGGGLGGLSALDVTDTTGAQSALTSIEGFLQTAIDTAASFGSSQKRISNQVEFVSQLSDSLSAGIGALVDADIEEASARLQSLQVQQQLGIQALSIANQQPQQLLGLFR